VLPDANVLIGEQATRTALATYGQQARWIHLATHAVFRADQPLFSALRLGDGWLTVQDVYDLNLGCELVTLSGCETGLSSISAGDELIGLARGFFAAGTPSLVVSLWAVNDESTAFLMQHFYRNLLQLPHSPEMGADKSAALRAAQMATRERYDHPYYWGPFVLLGRR
jgi:CHAT domain-containing protein